MKNDKKFMIYGIVVLVIIILLGIILLVLFNSKNKEENSNSDSSEVEIFEMFDEYTKATEDNIKGLEIKNVSIVDTGNVTHVKGLVKNISSDVDGVVVTFYTYNEDGSFNGKSSVSVSIGDRNSNNGFDISIMSKLVTDKYEVKIDYVK